ncbi:hypothetical protein SAMN05216188_116116 [Lentzea xinjiangensis]|uniref:DUF4350 domain-containing protein n=1 Tax=Lentzea xinjiangensis TaxID=402600 RepID=A0A1H9SJR3_9PSEU|nr:DUF4350 domain-containing protein [Lentzea xinjiangensis]SER85138.1 hypothetical protein SAMN05216188_116116 [Lentzea xinjiangensis]
MTAISPVSPDARRIWAAARGPLLIGVIILGAAIVITLLRGSGEGGSLDPRSYRPEGSRAVAHLLEQNGVRVELTDDASAVDGATLFVTHPNLIDPARLADLSRRAAATVLVAPAGGVGQVEARTRQPGCPLAAKAGAATTGGFVYEGEQRCYDSTVVRTGTVTALGHGAVFTNRDLDSEGNAALALSLLGGHERLVWYVPSAADRSQQKSLTDLVPDGWKFGALQLGVAAVLIALWRARRLGRVVPEPLPVVVRATETVEGRARLYRRSHAAGHAAAVLRQAARDRITPLLGLPAGEDPSDEIARRTSRPVAEVRTLLSSAEPVDDRGLVALASRLDALENEVRKG